MMIIHEKGRPLEFSANEQDDLWSLVTDGDIPPADLAQ
jgi:hypothetical protein